MKFSESLTVRLEPNFRYLLYLTQCHRVIQFLYAAKLIEQYLTPIKKRLYWNALVRIPAPKLIVFYNGIADQPDQTTLKLSDAFFEGTKGDVEATVKMLNINYGRNPELANACKPLQEYAWIIDKVRVYAKQVSTEDAIDQMISEMPETFLLKSFLIKHKGEVKGMILTEYDEIEHDEFLIEKGIEKRHRKRILKCHQSYDDMN